MTKHLPHPLRAITSRVLKRFGREEGSVLVLVAVVLPTLLLFGALGVDIARWFVHKDNAQNRADAAALAGADEFLKSPATCDQTAIKAQAASYVAKNAPTTDAGDIAVQTLVQCPDTFDAQGSTSYVDVTVTNTNVGGFFSHIAPTSIKAHARASLLAVNQLGGDDVMPFAIEQGDTMKNGQLVQIQVNAPEKDAVLQALVCDATSTPATKALANAKINTLMGSGCPTAQKNTTGTCPSPPANPPSCLARFTQMDEGAGFDTAFQNRFQDGVRTPCSHEHPVPTNNSALLPQHIPGDPRWISVYVVPDHTFDTNNPGPVPIVDFASFYWEGWDHDPCVNAKTNPDPDPPDQKLIHGSVWGVWVQQALPSGGGVSGTGPCVPSGDAADDTCVVQLTQ
jgi:Flp pilus assembly protein TadG